MTLHALNTDAEPLHTLHGRDDPNALSLLFQDWPLLDVQFEMALQTVRAVFTWCVSEVAILLQSIFHTHTLFVLKIPACPEWCAVLRTPHSAHHHRAWESRSLFIRPVDERDWTISLYAILMERAKDFESCLDT